MGGEGQGGSVGSGGLTSPWEAGFEGALEDRALCGYHFAAAPKSVAAPKSATALLGFASSALQMPIFFDSETQLFPDPATVAEKAALRGLRTAPGAVTSMHINHW